MKAKHTPTPWVIEGELITLIKINRQGWEFPNEDNWPCAVAFALGDPPNPVTEEEADRQAKLIAAAPFMLSALEAAYVALDAYSGGESSELMVVEEAIERATK